MLDSWNIPYWTVLFVFFPNSYHHRKITMDRLTNLLLVATLFALSNTAFSKFLASEDIPPLDDPCTLVFNG